MACFQTAIRNLAKQWRHGRLWFGARHAHGTPYIHAGQQTGLSCNAPLMTAKQHKVRQNTASGAHVARLNFDSRTSYDLINLLEHIIQSSAASHTAPLHSSSWVRRDRTRRGQRGKHSISCGQNHDLDCTACCQSVFPSFFHTAEDRPAQLQPYGRHGLVTSAPTVNLEERWDQDPAKVEIDRATFSAVTASHVSVSPADDGGAK